MLFALRTATLLVHGVMAVGIAGLGLFMRSIHRDSNRERWMSWVTWTLCVGGFASAGLVMVLFDWPPKEYLAVAVAGGGFGLLCGLAVGRFVWRYYRKEIEGDGEPIP